MLLRFPAHRSVVLLLRLSLLMSPGAAVAFRCSPLRRCRYRRRCCCCHVSVKYVSDEPAENITEAVVSVPEGMSKGGGSCVVM